MKPSVILEQKEIEKVKARFNETREPVGEWQSLLKPLITQIMDDYIRLQHPSKREPVYLKEAFLTAIAALWDDDFTFAEFKNEKGEDMSFKEVLAARFGIENLSISEIHKIDLGPIQAECIQEAKEYWLDKCLQVVELPDFLIFDGRSFSVWKSDDEEPHVDYKAMVIYVNPIEDEREMSEQFLQLSLEIAAYYRELKINKETLGEFSKAAYDLLRMNACFRQS
jgi:hypothetical protein